MFKLVNLLVILVILILNQALAESYRVNNDNAPFLYESRAEIRALDTTLAKYLSRDYRSANDEFTRHELFQQIKPIIVKRLNESKNVTNIEIKIKGKLSDYDFDKLAFPSGFKSATYIPYDYGYAIAFENADELEYIEVPFEDAKKLSGDLQKSRHASFQVFGKIIGVNEQRLSSRHNKVIRVEVSKIIAVLDSGKNVGEKEF